MILPHEVITIELQICLLELEISGRFACEEHLIFVLELDLSHVP
jgi:hypothetical protein